MTEFETLLKNYVEMNSDDRAGYFLAKIETIKNYSKTWPLLWDIIEAFIAKVTAADGKIDITEYALFQGLKIYNEGVPFDPQEFVQRIGNFVKDGANTDVQEAAFRMLPEYVRDDVVILLIAFATVDAELTPEERDWIELLAS
jgi:hypothetical protein